MRIDERKLEDGVMAVWLFNNLSDTTDTKKFEDENVYMGPSISKISSNLTTYFLDQMKISIIHAKIEPISKKNPNFFHFAFHFSF